MYPDIFKNGDFCFRIWKNIEKSASYFVTLSCWDILWFNCLYFPEIKQIIFSVNCLETAYVAGQNDRQTQILSRQTVILAGHCPVTGHYSLGWRQVLSLSDLFFTMVTYAFRVFPFYQCRNFVPDLTPAPPPPSLPSLFTFYILLHSNKYSKNT